MRFGAHETFHLREGWLHKGLRLLREDPKLLDDIDVAPDELGVGRNMAKSIRFWLEACGLAKPTGFRGKGALELTDLGNWIWTQDQHFEDEATWWIVQAHLASNLDSATVWFWLFNRFHEPRFTFAQAQTAWERFACRDRKRPLHPETLRRDLHCALRCYLGDPEARDDEDLSSPLGALGLFALSDSGQEYRRRTPPEVPLPVLGYTAALLRERRMGGSAANRILSIDELLHADGSPGRVFQLDRDTLLTRLEEMERTFRRGRVTLTRTAGVENLELRDEPNGWLGLMAKEAAYAHG